MHEQHDAFEAPTNSDFDVSVWRYMDLAKFISMLEAQALHFARVDTMEDAFEGSTTAPTLQLWRKITLGDDPPNEGFDRFEAQWSDANRRLIRDYAYLNCWHMNEHESVAMWKIYQSGAPQGIAIRSTYRRLSESITDERTVYIGTVSYADFDSDVIPDGNGFNRILHKRKFFEYEREIRAVHGNKWSVPHDSTPDTRDWAPVGPAVIPISVNLDTLVETVYVSPSAPAWFEQLIRDILARYSRTWPVRRSNLEGEPKY